MKQTDYKESFLQKYRELEAAVERVMGKGYAVKDFEDKHADVADELRLLRQIRNYATHNPNSSDILPIPKETAIYMDRMIACVLGPQKVIREVMSRAKPLSPDTTIQEAAKRLRSYPYLPVVDADKNICGVFTLEHLRDIVARGQGDLDIKRAFKGNSASLSDMGPLFVGPAEPVYDASLVISEKIPLLIVTSTGRMGGRYMGMWGGGK